MNLIVCVDDNMGIMFNKRRQSKDRLVIEDVCKISVEGKLFITPFSEKLFENNDVMPENINNSTGESNDYWFIEDMNINSFSDKIDKLILYKWNRVYPADTYLDIDLSNWRVETTVEFAGNSHEKITREIYVKN